MKKEKSSYIFECKSCGQVRKIINRVHGLCFSCNYYRLHKETPFQTAIKKQKEKNKEKYKIQNKCKPKKKKVTGEMKMFKEIWEERSHFCQNKLCGRYLGEVLQPIFFSHNKSKGAYPSLRLCKDNVSLLCQQCHFDWDFGNRSKIEL